MITFCEFQTLSTCSGFTPDHWGIKPFPHFISILFIDVSGSHTRRPTNRLVDGICNLRDYRNPVRGVFLAEVGVKLMFYSTDHPFSKSCLYVAGLRFELRNTQLLEILRNIRRD